MNVPIGKQAQARRGTLLILAVGTAIGSMGLAAGGTSGALLGVEMTGSEAVAGLPLGLLVAGSAAAALLVSRRTDSAGRGRSLALGYVLGASGAAMVVAAAAASSLILLLFGSALLGAGNAAIFLTRYAAAEVGGEAMRGRALGIVLFATAFGAVVSPSLLGPSGDLASIIGLPSLAGLYLVAIPCFAVSALLLAAVSNPKIPALGGGAMLLGPRDRPRVTKRDLASGLAAPSARAALVILASTNLVMVAVMAIAPVHLTAHGHGLGLVGFIIGVHVTGMFAPSPVSGWMADRIGPAPVAASGMLLLAAAGVAGALVDQDSAAWITVVLMMLGIGWNLGVVGGSTLLAASVSSSLRPHVEGMGEVAMGLAAGAGAPIAGLIVALGSLTILLIAGAVTATLTFAFVRLLWNS